MYIKIIQERMLRIKRSGLMRLRLSKFDHHTTDGEIHEKRTCINEYREFIRLNIKL